MKMAQRPEFPHRFGGSCPLQKNGHEPLYPKLWYFAWKPFWPQERPCDQSIHFNVGRPKLEDCSKIDFDLINKVRHDLNMIFQSKLVKVWPALGGIFQIFWKALKNTSNSLLSMIKH